MICGPFDRQLAASVIECLDDPTQPHLNEKDRILVLAHVRGHVREAVVQTSEGVYEIFESDYFLIWLKEKGDRVSDLGSRL